MLGQPISLCHLLGEAKVRGRVLCIPVHPVGGLAPARTLAFMPGLWAKAPVSTGTICLRLPSVTAINTKPESEWH